MSVLRARRRWFVLAIVVVLVLASYRALDSSTRIDWYRLIDRQTLIVSITTSPHAWTRVTSLVETPSSVTVTVSTLSIAPGPSTAAGYRVDLVMKLAAPLGDRPLIDGKTGEPVAVRVDQATP